MRLTQMLAVLNGEVPKHNYHRLSHYAPELEARIELTLQKEQPVDKTDRYKYIDCLKKV